jgi:hypothetical protein
LRKSDGVKADSERSAGLSRGSTNAASLTIMRPSPEKFARLSRPVFRLGTVPLLILLGALASPAGRAEEVETWIGDVGNFMRRRIGAGDLFQTATSPL